MATGSSTDGHGVVRGWPRGRPRMAVHGWPQGRPRMATGSSTDGHRVVHGWPQGRPRMATGSSTDGQGSPFKPSTDGGRTRSVAGRRRCTIVHQNGSEGRLLQVIYGWPTGRPRRAQPLHIPAVSCRELTGTTALNAWSASCAGFTGVVEDTVEIPRLADRGDIVDTCPLCGNRR